MAVADPPTVQQRLADLLELLQFWKESEAVPPPSNENKDAPLRWLRFWQRHERDATDSVRQLRGVGDSLRRGDLDSAQDQASGINLRWLNPFRPQGGGGVVPVPPARDEASEIEQRARAVAAFIAEALCPWDYDRREPAVTFANTWTDRATADADDDSQVKITSTIKPLYQEWKLTARTMLIELGDNGVVFGKAGIYLAGDLPAYIGLEADKVVDVPRLKNTKLFVNANYRSSRKPFATPVVASAGVQQTLPLNKRLELTFRLGVSTRSGAHRVFFTPVPYGTYF